MGFDGVQWDFQWGFIGTLRGTYYGELIMEKLGFRWFSINITKPARFVAFSPECRKCSWAGRCESGTLKIK